MRMEIDREYEGFDGFGEFLKTTYTSLIDRGEIVCSPDNIAYTDDFERLYAHMLHQFPCTRHDVFKTLINVRKKKKKQDEDSNGFQLSR